MAFCPLSHFPSHYWRRDRTKCSSIILNLVVQIEEQKHLKKKKIWILCWGGELQQSVPWGREWVGGNANLSGDVWCWSEAVHDVPECCIASATTAKPALFRINGEKKGSLNTTRITKRFLLEGSSRFSVREQLWHSTRRRDGDRGKAKQAKNKFLCMLT